MDQIAGTAHLLWLRSTQYLDRRIRLKMGGHRERGSVTIEQVLWAVAVIAIVAIVVAAIKAYVTTQAGNIN